MDFARRQLEKYGWTDGKGLGKNENGISEALKPKLKRSQTGIGHDPAADFTEHWWSALYDKAAKNVEVEEKDGKTKKIKTKDDQFKITSSTYQLNKKPGATDKEEYSEFFIRKAVLTGEGGQEKVGESESEEEKEKRDVFKLTDEELFAACEGRTAHKGARHGLKATGKLARIAQQEQMLLAQPQYEGYSHAKKLKNDKNSAEHDKVVEDTNLDNEGDCIQNKKKKKKRKHCMSIDKDENLAESSEPLLVEDTELMAADNNDISTSINKKCKKSKRKQDDDQNEESSTKSKKKKRQCEEQTNAMEVDAADNHIEESEPKVKKCKKKKKKDSDM